MRRTEAQRSSRRGFTLIEVAIATSLSAIVIVGMLSAYLFLAKNMTRLGTTENFDRRSQRAMVLFSRDVGTATKISSYTEATSGGVTTISLAITVPSGSVTYGWSGSSTAPGSLTRSATVGATTTAETLVRDVASAVVTRRDGNGYATSTLFNTRQLQLTLTGALRSSSGTTLATRIAASPNLLIASQALIQ